MIDHPSVALALPAENYVARLGRRATFAAMLSQDSFTKIQFGAFCLCSRTIRISEPTKAPVDIRTVTQVRAETIWLGFFGRPP